MQEEPFPADPPRRITGGKRRKKILQGTAECGVCAKSEAVKPEGNDQTHSVRVPESQKQEKVPGNSRAELDQYNEAVLYFKENTGGKVPAIKSLKAEKEHLQQLIKKQKALLSSFRQEQQELQTASSNIDTILGEASTQIRGKRKTEPER